ncbi:hypothetical protein K469DRAFT_744148 [Zopfia rhizophila CBS 207.26]|uniref:Uncharacterized protein n=1 Tax=Zopfia rhizophila CBS 207.26 TaxID=1314779 RepID=A0A6A6F0G9_9PEZI|nr:hypothetical protein K469DRAFT_744148 [Zopfia rhizophila CBS 207.26]
MFQLVCCAARVELTERYGLQEHSQAYSTSKYANWVKEDEEGLREDEEGLREDEEGLREDEEGLREDEEGLRVDEGTGGGESLELAIKGLDEEKDALLEDDGMPELEDEGRLIIGVVDGVDKGNIIELEN